MEVLRQRPVLLLGLGNTILSDDGVGIHVARHAREQLRPGEPIEVLEAELAGFSLLDLLSGREAAVIVDAIELAGLSPGDVRRMDLSDFRPTTRLAGAHQIDLPTALALGRQIGEAMPHRVVIVAVQVGEARTLGEELTPAVAAAVQPAAALALRVARELSRPG